MSWTARHLASKLHCANDNSIQYFCPTLTSVIHQIFSDDDDDSDEDDEMELQMELERIKAERAASQSKKDLEEKDLQDRKNTENAMKGNPLVNMSDSESAKVKRRWNDDVVFRNQARDEPEHKKRFINDTIRNDFHRQFLKKFMK